MVNIRILTLTSCYQLVALGVAVAAALAVWREGALGILLGGILMGANFWALRSLAGRVLLAKKKKLVYGLALALKLVATLAAIAAFLAFFKAHAAGFALGMATLFVGIMLAVAHQAVLGHQPVSSSS